MLTVDGANYFGENEGFGIEYGYLFPNLIYVCTEG